MKSAVAAICAIFLIGTNTPASGRMRTDVEKNYHREIILGKNPVSIKHYSFAAALIMHYQTQPTHICEVGIITKDYVITAAHCIAPEDRQHAISIGKLVIRGGATNIVGRTGYDHRIFGYSIHEHYDASRRVHDIALIKVKDPFVNIFEKPVAYAKENYTATADRALCIGWGKTDVSIRQLLTITDVKITEKCLGFANNPAQFCTIPLVEEFCIRDSSGLIYQNNLLVGIVTSTKEQCRTYTRMAFARISYYKKWIKRHLNKNNVVVDRDLL